MTTFCLFCKKIIKNKKSYQKYCSTICNKRSWYIRHNPNCKSYLAKNPDFWKTETGKGLKWEKYGAKLLGAKLTIFKKNGVELNWNGKLVDVKSCNLYKRKFKRGKPVVKEQNGVWVFNRNKPKQIDYFLCICLVKNKLVKKYLIPNSEFPKRGTVIGHQSKYDKFLC